MTFVIGYDPENDAMRYKYNSNAMWKSNSQHKTLSLTSRLRNITDEVKFHTFDLNWYSNLKFVSLVFSVMF